VAGIGAVRAGRIAATWAEQRHIRDVMTASRATGLHSLAVRIYKKFGDDSGRVVAQEPSASPARSGHGFKTADKIAQAVGIAPDAPARLQRASCMCSGPLRTRAHALPEADLTDQAIALLAADAPPVQAASAVLLATGRLWRLPPR